MMYFVLAAVLVALDQLTKLLVRINLQIGEQIVLVPHFVGITRIQNTGMAFSALTGKTAFLTVVSLIASVVMAYVLAKNVLFKHPLGKIPLTLIFAGAVGNLIDRFFMGYVTDMIQVLFMNFAIFNFADCCVVVGTVTLSLYVLLLWDKYEPHSFRK